MLTVTASYLANSPTPTPTFAIAAGAALAVRLVAWLCDQPFALGHTAWVVLDAAGMLTLTNIGGSLLTSPDINGTYDLPHSAR